MNNYKISFEIKVEPQKSEEFAYGTKDKFKHLKKHKINDQIILINIYHCSKYNINTKRLKISDLDNVFKLIKKLLHF